MTPLAPGVGQGMGEWLRPLSSCRSGALQTAGLTRSREEKRLGVCSTGFSQKAFLLEPSSATAAHDF